MTSGKKPGKISGKKPDTKVKSKISGSSAASGKSATAGKTGNIQNPTNPVNKYTKASAAILIVASVAIVVIVLAALFLFPGNTGSTSSVFSFGPDQNADIPGDTKSAVVQEMIGTGNESIFYEEAYVNPENLIFRVVPTGEGAANYSTEYQVDLEYGNDFTGAENLTGISAKNPVELNITKSPGEWVNIHINITAENGTLLWESQSGYA